MTQPFRLSNGGLIDRQRPLNFTFNDQRYQGYAGDSLAAALLANGVALVARSFKYHRPRGIVSAGAEEPNALVQLETGARTLPNTRATQIELYDGLIAASQNCWPSVGFDLRSINALLSRLLPAGFYYKTFMGPRSWWPLYERVIRAAAGMGRAPAAPDPDSYEHRHAQCDVLVVGSGPAGLAAALAAARTGARVMVVEQDHQYGGSLLFERVDIEQKPALDWVAQSIAELQALPQVTLLLQATVAGYFDQNALMIAQHLRPSRNASTAMPRERLWKVRAQQVILATGSIERPLIFGNNDRPGVMLASAARTYVNRYAVKPGTRAVIFTNNDSPYPAACDLKAAGIDIAALIDARPAAGERAMQNAIVAGIDIRFNSAITNVHGGARVNSVDIATIDADGNAGTSRATIDCDLVCMSGGWSPAVHLHSQAQGKLRYEPSIAAFVPATIAQAARSAGAANGTLTLAGCLAEGGAAGAAAAHAAGHGDGIAPQTPTVLPEHDAPLQALWQIHTQRREPSFVDLQNDVTTADIAIAAREGYTSVEHLKRYTTLGMGTDQGKLSNINGLAILAGILGQPIPAVGTTTFRAPYTPVTFGALAGHECGEYIAPTRRSAMHAWHITAGAKFVNAGLWLRPQLYPRPGESDSAAIQRQARAVRTGVGLVDVSTLGKIDLKGRDVAEFLERIYINKWKSLAIGKVRYGVMLREDGVVFDDGTTARLGEQHYLMTTTTVNAARVMSWLEYWLQVEWPNLEVYATAVTEHWSAMALAGPQARAVLATLAPEIDWSDTVLPYLGWRAETLAGIPARIFRVSFSGELSYEINVPADYGQAMWAALMAAGANYGITPYGTEAMGVLRIEKGHVTGMELDGRTTPADLGMGALLKTTTDFIGARSLKRPAQIASDRKQLVGLRAADGVTPIPRGAQLVADPKAPLPNPILGHVTSTCFSAALEQPIALALLASGPARHGETLYATAPLAGVTLPVTVVDTVFYDAAGARARG